MAAPTEEQGLRYEFWLEFAAVERELCALRCGADGAIGPVLYPVVRYFEDRFAEFEHGIEGDFWSRREAEAFERAWAKSMGMGVDELRARDHDPSLTAVREASKPIDPQILWEEARAYRPVDRGRKPEKGQALAGVRLAVADALTRNCRLNQGKADAVTALAETAARASLKRQLGAQEPSIDELPSYTNYEKTFLVGKRDSRDRSDTGWWLLANAKNVRDHLDRDRNYVGVVMRAFELAKGYPHADQARNALARAVRGGLARQPPAASAGYVPISGKTVSDARGRHKHLLPNNPPYDRLPDDLKAFFSG